MDDHELLELAAKAEGRDLSKWEWRLGSFWLPGLRREYVDRWNPLAVDGDVFRLAVKLGIHFAARDGDGGGGWAEHIDGGCYQEFNEAADIVAALRRAIVRVAAEIGKGMP